MYLFCRLQLSRIRKHFQGVLPDRFEHQQAWLISALVALLQQAFVKQGCDQVDGGKREICSSGTDRFCSLQRTASDKDGQAPETMLLLGIQEIITPADGITQFLLPGPTPLPSPPQHCNPMLQHPWPTDVACRIGQKHFTHRGRGFESLLKHIAQENEVFVRQGTFKGLEQRTFAGHSRVGRLWYGGQDQLRVADRSKVRQADTLS